MTDKPQLRQKDVQGTPSNGGKFAAHQHSDAPEGLLVAALPPRALPPEPTAEQLARATEDAGHRMDNVQFLDEWDRDNTEYQALIQKYAAQAAVREAGYEAWKRGEPHETDTEFEDMWEGRAIGFSREKVTANLERDRHEQQEFLAGRIRPSAVIGTGYKRSYMRRGATEWFERTIASSEEALRSGGRSISVNQGNALSRVKERTSAPLER
jgi:hypothetical protein